MSATAPDNACPDCGGPWVKGDEIGIQSLDARLCPKMHAHGGSYELRHYTCANGHTRAIYHSAWKNIDGCEHRVEPVPRPTVRAEVPSTETP